MHQRDLVKQAWQAAGLYSSKDAKLQQFLKKLDDAPLDCWPELVAECRANYAKYMARLVAPLVSVGDKLLRVNLVRNADFGNPAELALAQEFIAQSDPVKDTHELKALLLSGSRPLVAAVQKVRGLTPELSALAVQALARTAKPKGAPAKAKPARARKQPK